jgi:hypothetical protein
MLGYQLLISKTSSQGASYTQTIVIFTLEESEEVLNKQRGRGEFMTKLQVHVTDEGLQATLEKRNSRAAYVEKRQNSGL